MWTKVIDINALNMHCKKNSTNFRACTAHETKHLKNTILKRVKTFEKENNPSVFNTEDIYKSLTNTDQ